MRSPSPLKGRLGFGALFVNKISHRAECLRSGRTQWRPYGDSIVFCLTFQLDTFSPKRKCTEIIHYSLFITQGFSLNNKKKNRLSAAFLYTGILNTALRTFAACQRMPGRWGSVGAKYAKVPGYA